MIERHYSRVWAVGLALLPLAISCSRGPAKPITAVLADPLTVSTPRDRYADDLGRFLAGVPARAGSQFDELEKQPAWIKHQREMDHAWSRLEQATLPAMRVFQKQNLGAALVAKSPVFYPFSGPDALMVTVLFPDNPTYVMVGLEPAGTLPRPGQIERKNLEAYLASVRNTLASELSRSFFVTRQMDRQFRGQVSDGLLLPILELLVRSGHTILGFRYVRLDDAGRMIERSAGYKAPGRIGNKGVEIDFRRDDDQSVHKLVYLSVNLSDKSLTENQAFLTFLASLKGTATLLKATSYMVHKQDFSTIRERVLAKSVAVLQDDSGIPYRFFAAPAWTVQLYGSYVRPYGSFRWLQQADLRAAYLSAGPKPLGFRIGYGYGKVPSNLLFARKTD
ncbi:MAG: hypothetical protein ABSC93_15600 [Bryobacteraceae bacterium]|jgi:hypothetical protein